ncbi:MAG: GreA/GreB family elongation factor [Actinomycetota bacterium]
MPKSRFKRNPGDQPSAMLTQDAYERLRKELDQLKGEGRDRMAERLLHARELGDIRENAEYDAAKNEQGLMEARIRELERLLKDPDIVEGAVAAEEAGPGQLVTVKALDDADEEEETYLLAASKEERHEDARTVSIDSPLGQALAGKRIGDRVEYQAPGGKFSFEITALKPQG